MLKKVLLVLLVVVIVIGGYLGFQIYNGYQDMLDQMENEDPTYWTSDVDALDAKYSTSDDVDIVLTGSSSPRKWETYQEDFAPYSIVDTGFGGSKVADSTYWYDDTIGQYNPEVIVFWAGTNDIHGMSDESKTGEETFELFTQFYETAKSKNPDVSVVFIPVNPTKARDKVWDQANEYNQLVANMATTTDDLYYVDVTDALMKDGTYNPDYLQNDGLHLNEQGYSILSDYTMPVVEEALNNTTN